MDLHVTIITLTGPHLSVPGGKMDVDNNMRVEPEETPVDEHHCPQLGGNQLLTSRLKIASRSAEKVVKANPAQLVGAAVLTGSVALALYLFKRRKRPSNKGVQTPPGSPQVSY